MKELLEYKQKIYGLGAYIPIYILAMKENVPLMQGNIILTKEYVFIADVDINAGICNYVRFDCGSYQCWHNHEPFNTEESKKIQERTERAEKIIREIIENDLQFPVHAAAPAIPKDLQLIGGGFSLITYNKETNGFERVKVSEDGAMVN